MVLWMVSLCILHHGVKSFVTCIEGLGVSATNLLSNAPFLIMVASVSSEVNVDPCSCMPHL